MKIQSYIVQKAKSFCTNVIIITITYLYKGLFNLFLTNKIINISMEMCLFGI